MFFERLVRLRRTRARHSLRAARERTRTSAVVTNPDHRGGSYDEPKHAAPEPALRLPDSGTS